MSQENVEVVQRAVEAWNRGEWTPVSAKACGPDIVCDFTPSGIPGLGIYPGQAETKRCFEDDWFSGLPIR